MSEANLPQLLMRRGRLDDLPDLCVPEGFNARHFADGDEAAWEHIIERTLFPMKFDEGIRSADFYKNERVWFICRDEVPVATATAWVYEKQPATGYVHMVGALPEWKGHGLGCQVSLAALLQMRADGVKDAVLHTDDHRLPAIKIYLKLGFEPIMEHESHEQRWRDVFSALH